MFHIHGRLSPLRGIEPIDRAEQRERAGCRKQHGGKGDEIGSNHLVLADKGVCRRQSKRCAREKRAANTQSGGLLPEIRQRVQDRSIAIDVSSMRM